MQLMALCRVPRHRQMMSLRKPCLVPRLMRQLKPSKVWQMLLRKPLLRHRHLRQGVLPHLSGLHKYTNYRLQN